MRRVSVRLLLVFVLALVAPLAALAQHTGGSFGGSRWGSGRSSSSSSSSRSGGSWGSGSSSRSSWGSGSSSGSYGGTYGGGSYGSYGGSSGGSSGGDLGLICCVLTFFVLVVLIGAALSKKKGVANVTYTPNYTPGGFPADDQDTFSLGALAIAFESNARPQVQAALDRIAQTMNNNPDALDQAAAQMGQALGGFLDAAFMTHHSLMEGVPMQQAQAQFQAAVDAERGRFIVETVRGDAGGVRKINAPQSRSRAEEGAGFVVVTVLVARRGRFTGFVPPTDRNILRNDLQILLGAGTGMQALECVWVPSDPNDIMSSAEMAVKFPTLRPLSPDARVGRRACAYCKSVYAGELPRCPNCGAPAT